MDDILLDAHCNLEKLYALLCCYEACYAEVTPENNTKLHNERGNALNAIVDLANLYQRDIDERVFNYAKQGRATA
jgi:hypothetical protein